MSYAAQMLRIGVRQERDGRLLRIEQVRDLHRKDCVMWIEHWERAVYKVPTMSRQVAAYYLAKLGDGVIFEDKVSK